MANVDVFGFLGTISGLKFRSLFCAEEQFGIHSSSAATSGSESVVRVRGGEGVARASGGDGVKRARSIAVPDGKFTNS